MGVPQNGKEKWVIEGCPYFSELSPKYFMMFQCWPEKNPRCIPIYYAKYHVYMMKQMAATALNRPTDGRPGFLRLVNLKMIQNIESGGFNQKRSGI